MSHVLAYLRRSTVNVSHPLGRKPDVAVSVLLFVYNQLNKFFKVVVPTSGFFTLNQTHVAHIPPSSVNSHISIPLTVPLRLVPFRVPVIQSSLLATT
jgi:hypothetical protein